MLENILGVIKDIIIQPALILGLISFIGLVALKKPAHLIMQGTLGPILGYIMMSAGSAVIVSNLDPLSKLIEAGFKIKGVVPNNEAVVAVAQQTLGMSTMLILVLGYVFNIIIAGLTKYKYIFLTGHHSFFMACLFSAVLSALGFDGAILVILGGFFLGAWSALSPAIGQKITNEVTDKGEIAMGHFGSIGYYLAGFIAEKVGNKNNGTEDIKIPESFGFLRDTTISTAIIMLIFYLVPTFAAGMEFASTLSNGTNSVVFAIMCALQFAIGVNIVYAGVRMIVRDLVPAFQGISEKIIKDAVPAVDCAVFFTFAQNAVVIGFISSFIAGVISLFITGAIGWVLIIPGLVPHFFCGGTAGVYASKKGGIRGCIIGSFINGILISFLPALLLPVLGNLGFANTTFGDADFALLGIIIGKVGSSAGEIGVYVIAVVFLLVLIIPNFIKTKSNVINND